MQKRRHCRESAIQILFAGDYNPDESGGQPHLPGCSVSEKDMPFVTELVNGVVEHKEEIDSLILENSSRWAPNRISGVDRNIMRVALFEMLYRPDIPPVVSINEAVDIAKKFSSEKSGGFINGVLDHIALKLKRSLRTVSPSMP